MTAKGSDRGKSVTLRPVDFWRFRAQHAERAVVLLRVHETLLRLKAEERKVLDEFCGAHGFDADRPLEFNETTLSVTQEPTKDRKPVLEKKDG